MNNNNFFVSIYTSSELKVCRAGSALHIGLLPPHVMEHANHQVGQASAPASYEFRTCCLTPDARC